MIKSKFLMTTPRNMAYLYTRKRNKSKLMKSIILFPGSNSSTSINKQLIDYAATLFKEVKATVIDLRSYEPPVFSVDLENEIGIHPKIQALVEVLEAADG